MSFYGRTIIFDGIPSENYNLMILSFENSGELSETNAGAEVSTFETWIPRRPQPFHYGNYLNTPLEFDITLGAIDPIIGLDRSRIGKWLLGRGTYLKLQICEDDIQNFYINVIFTATNKYVGNVQRGITLHAVANSPWWYEMPRTLSYNFTGNTIKNFTADFYNDTDANVYMYPYVDFTLNSIGNSMSITNITDNNRVFSFTGISPYEHITVDCDKQIITSSTGLYRMTNFNKQWLRFVPGLNKLHIISGIGILKITYQFARNVGG